jgi:cytoskeletal protein RodZ
MSKESLRNQSAQHLLPRPESDCSFMAISPFIISMAILFLISTFTMQKSIQIDANGLDSKLEFQPEEEAPSFKSTSLPKTSTCLQKTSTPIKKEMMKFDIPGCAHNDMRCGRRQQQAQSHLHPIKSHNHLRVYPSCC